jgi:Undecaprenyl-phosphate galactose phosphotransferase WbaP
LSTQADEVITTHLAVETPIRKGSPRPHLILKEQRMTFDGSGPELTADAVAFDEALLPRAQPHVWQTPSRTAARFLPRSRSYRPLKRVLDIVGAVTIGLAFSPLLVVIAVRMGLEDGPILFRHRRIGQGGRTFECLKFRTMVPNAEQILHDLLERDAEARAEWLRDHKLRCDPRVTRLGRFLRKTSLDELPQIWNVLRGDMSLVGPRPIVKEEMLRYGRYLPAYMATKPGITGLWQVTGRNDTNYRRRVVMDTYYVRKQTLLMDLRILLKTVKVVLWGHGAY